MNHIKRRPSAAGRTCVLHIGMHKTGSSSIQHSLFNAPASPDWTLVRGKTGNAGFALHAVFGSPDTDQSSLKRIGMSKEKVAHFAQQSRRRLKESLGKTAPLCLLSAEGMTRLEADSLVRLRDWLSLRVEKIRVVGYVRTPHEFIESALQERIKSGHMKRLSLERVYPGYRRRLEKFDQVFGRECVELRLFEPASFPQSDVVLDFARWVGIHLPEDQSVRANDGLSAPALRLLLAANAVRTPALSVAQRYKAQRQLVIALRSLGGPKLRLAPSLLAPVLEDEAEDLQWLEDRMGVPIRRQREIRPGVDLEDLAELAHYGPESVAWLNQALAEAGLEEQPPRSSLPHGSPRDIGQAMVRLLQARALPRVQGAHEEPDDPDEPEDERD